MYGHNPHHPNYHAGDHPNAHSQGLATTSGTGPMRGGPWPVSTGLDMAGVKAWLETESLGVKHKWWALGIGTLAVGALVVHGRQARWF